MQLYKVEIYCEDKEILLYVIARNVETVAEHFGNWAKITQIKDMLYLQENGIFYGVLDYK